MGIFNGLKTIFNNSNPAQNNTSPNQSAPQGQSQPNPQAKKVLIVEDETLLANALELKFKNEGYNVLKAENGQIGLDTAIANKPDLILLDLLMPVMDGKAMLHSLRKLPEFKNLPVIILTNAGDVDNMRQTQFYDHASSFLIKANVNPEDVVREAEKFLS